MTSTAEPPVETTTHTAPRFARVSRVSLAFVGVAVVVGFGVIKLARPLGQSFTSAGDIAFIELGVRQAVHHGTALGVYSRFGWHHPGPALFYFLAPWYSLSGESSRSLFMAAWIVNGGCALGAVWIVRARAGERAARVLAVVLFAFVIVAGFDHFIDSWNPKLLALPVLLLMVSVAAAYSGSAWSFVVALGTASYLVQAHLGTLPISVALLALATVGLWRARPRDSSLRAPLIVATCLLALFWIGPVVQQVTGSDGNLSQIARFYRHPGTVTPTSHSFGSAIDVVSNHATVVPLGNPTNSSRDANALVLAGAFAAVGLGAFFGARRRAPFIAALGLTTPIGLAVALIAASRVIGPLDGYLFYWTEALPIPAIVAGVWLLMERAPSVESRHRATSIAAIVVAVVLVAISFRSIARARPTTFGNPREARAIAARIESAVATKSKPFTLHVGTPRVDQGALAVQLDKDGYRFHVEPAINLYRGNVTHRVEGPSFEIRDAGTAPPPGAHEQPVATIGRIDVSVAP